MSEHRGYQLIEERFVKEIDSKVSFYRHQKTGAEILSIENDDENKVFGITLRTPPPDSSGLPHIMEHSVLCGSRKYRVKEPFVELMKGSLNTFLNAFTYPDKTCYPVASTNLKDFYNLVDVYLDSVFFPLLSPYTLMQEGWHYELDRPDGEMTFKGVVFNEMKGAFSSPDDILGDESQMALFPDTPYGLHSGGDPEVIPSLTYEQFRNFHKVYYHPSNARFFFYGDDDVDTRFAKLDEYLDLFDHIKVDSHIPLQTRFTEPSRKIIPYDSGESGTSSKAYILLNWLLREANDVVENISLSILGYILIATPASPLKKALSESGLGEEVIGRGLEGELRQLSFSTGLRGVEVENLDKVEQLILTELANIATNGLDPKTIEAALNTIEFRLRENNTGSFPRGLLVMLRSLGNWLYDLDPIAPLEFQIALDNIKQNLIHNATYFEDLIKKYLLDNPHRVTIILVPDETLGKARDENEKARLSAARLEMNADDIQQIVADTIELKHRQDSIDSPEALAAIPMLSLEDLDPQVNTIPLEVQKTSEGCYLYHDLFTSDILYLDLAFDLKALPQEYLSYLSLFSGSLLEMGTEKEDFVSLIQRIGRESGGINASIYTSDDNLREEPLFLLFIRAKAIGSQLNELLSILSDIIFHPKFEDKERFRQMVLEEKSSLEAGLIPSGHRVVNNRLRSHYSQAAWITEQTSGLDYLMFIRSLAESLDQDWEMIQNIIASIRKLIFTKENLTVNITIDDSQKATTIAAVKTFMQQFPSRPPFPAAWPKKAFNDNEGLTIPSQVNFVAKGANLYELGYQYHGSINVITSFLKGTWLWDKVRVQGGAYGGFLSFDRLSGILTYLSYRDPNLIETLKVYDQTSEFLRNVQISAEELEKSIIGAIGDLQTYMLPDAKGFTSLIRYLLNISDSDRQLIRDQVLATTTADFTALAPYLDKVKDHGQVVVLGSPQAIQSANQHLPDFLKTRKIM